MQHETDFRIAPPEPGREAEALELALTSLDPEQRSRQIAIMLREAADDRPREGLAVASRGNRWLGAICWQLQPGRAATVWPPGLLADQPQLALALLEAACAAIAERNVQLAQCLLAPESHGPRESLEAAGFEHLADLYYMVSLPADFPHSPPPSPLIFEPYRKEIHRRFATVVEATYRGTQDCPRLNGVRPIEDVLDGYRASSGLDPTQWLLVRNGGTDVGCLILADYPAQGNYELVYMGVLAETRGNRWGENIARYAQWRAHAAGRQRLVLAVDAGNRPALGVYTRVGFRVWDQRSVLAKIFRAPD